MLVRILFGYVHCSQTSCRPIKCLRFYRSNDCYCVCPNITYCLPCFFSAYNRKDPEVARLVDIGLPTAHLKERAQALERSKILANVKKDPQMERLARERKCKYSCINGHVIGCTEVYNAKFSAMQFMTSFAFSMVSFFILLLMILFYLLIFQ